MAIELPNWPPTWPEIERAIASVISDGQWGSYHSDICATLQSRLTEVFASADCRLTCSGTAAIELAMRAARVGPGSEVVLAAYDYPGNFRTIELLGATPVLVDVAPGSPVIDVDQIEAAASERVVAVLASHLYGQAADVLALREICDARGWLLVEDACQVPGLKIGDRPAGSFGDFAAISFGGSKPVTAGAGGALLMRDQKWAARLAPIIDRPSDAFPLSPLQAAAIGPQLDRLGELNQQRAATADWLVRSLPEIEWIVSKVQPVTPAFYKLAWKSPHPLRCDTLPIGKGFRATAQTSDRRSRKPVPLDRSLELSERCRVLDHRALLVGPEQRAALVDLLRKEF